MTPQEAIEALNALTGVDPEGDHAAADQILLKVAPADVAEAYEALTERAAGWWYA